MIQLQKYKGMFVSGYSRAAHKTGILISGLNIILDAGLDVQRSFDHVFITHQHLDHVKFLPQYTLNTKNEKKINVVSTERIISKVKPYVSSTLMMSKNISDKNTASSLKYLKYLKSIEQSEHKEHTEHTEHTEYIECVSHAIKVLEQTQHVYMDDEMYLKVAHIKFNPISIGGTYTFANGRENWRVELIKCTHSVDSIGFGFSVQKKKLKPEFASLSNSEIKKIKDVYEITAITEEKIFLFLGDTNKKVLENVTIYEYPTIIIECTYFEDGEQPLAKKNKHIHWDDIKNIIIKNEKIQFILIHFSMKYTDEHIRTFFGKQNICNLSCII